LWMVDGLEGPMLSAIPSETNILIQAY